MEAKDINGLTLLVGDRVAFSDAGRMGSVHLGVITVILKAPWGEDYRVYIKDDKSKRTNVRYSRDVLCINGLTVPN